MKRSVRILVAAVLLAALLCGCTTTPEVGQTPTAPTTPSSSTGTTVTQPATQGVISSPSIVVTEVPTEPENTQTQIPAETETPVVDVTPGKTETVTNPPTKKPTKEPTKAPTLAPTEVVTKKPTATPTVKPTPTTPESGPTVTHQEVSKWDYHFTYGSASIKGTALTRFNEGGATGITSGEPYGSATVTSNGLLLKAGNSGAFDSYGAYRGANLKTADFSKAKYLGITVTNNDNKEVLFAPQGTDSTGKQIWLCPVGDAIALAPANGGTVYAADGVGGVSGRYAIKIPANFNGYVLIPINRLCESPDSATATKWTSIRPIHELGFHYAGALAADNGLLVSAVFICDVALTAPDKIASGIMNENYSYTNAQRIAPFWKNGTMYNESMTMVKRSDGSIYGKLLFVPTKINAVVDVNLKKEYKEGVDWRWVQGTNKIEWLNGSSIPYFTEADLRGDGVAEYPNWDSQGRSRFGNCLYCVSAFLYEKQICVSYTYNTNQVQSQGIQVTSIQDDRLPRTIQKLKSNQSLKVLFYGDSIFSGCDASGMYNRNPYMPYMHKLIEARLQEETTGKVTVDNIAVGGWTVENGLSALSGSVGGINYSNSYQGYDLLILSFGMNNANTNETTYKNSVRGIINKIKAANPNMEVILVSCMNPNPRATGFCGNQKYHGTWNFAIAEETNYKGWVGIVDMYGIHKSILNYKDFSATTGNNINHPNDWLIRVYAQNILATMLG